MRWLARAIGGSLAVHAAIVAAAAAWHPRHDPPPVVDEVAAAPDDVTLEPIAAPVPIELVTLASLPPPARDPREPIPAVAPPPPPGAPPPPAAPPTDPRRRDPRDAAGAPPAAITTATAAGAAATTATEPGRPDDAGARQLAMRDPYRRPDAADVGAIVDEIASRGGPPPPPTPDSGRVAPDGQGARIDDTTFTGHVDPDGTVHIEDKPNVHVKVHVPSKRDIGNALDHWAEDPYGYAGATSTDQDKIEHADRGDGARVTDKDQRPDQGQVVPIVSGGFDVTDWIARKALGQAKGDPYAARKRAALDETRDERAEMGRRHRKDQLDHADAIVRDTLGRVWASGLALADKKEGFFEMWDECAETGDAAEVDAGQRARREIVGFIRAHLPAGSADAFTAAELAAMNQHRSSKARFAPYDDAP